MSFLRLTVGRARRWGLVFAALGALGLAGPRAQAQGPLRYDDWRLEWAEEFDQPGDSSLLAARWQFAYPWGRALPANPETEYYTGAALRLAGGQLHLDARRLPVPRHYLGRDLHYTSGMLFSRHPAPDTLQPAACRGGEGFSYGLFEIRCRQPRDPTAFPAFWLFGTPDEVDIFEGSTVISNGVHLNPHPYWRPNQPAQSCACAYTADPRHPLHEDFHTYGVAWLPGELVFYFDGYPIRRETRYVPLGCPLSLIANLAMWNWATAASAELAIDYIRVYRPRQLPVRLAAHPGPPPATAWQPTAADPDRPDPAPRQLWQAQPAAPGRLRLALLDNLNPACESVTPLPTAAGWSPPWVLVDGLPALRVRAAPVPAEWALYGLAGNRVLSGAVPAGAEWQPAWAAVPPGAYQLWLRQGPAQTRQRVLVVDGTLRAFHGWADAAGAPAP